MKKISEWIHKYNTRRTHSAIGYLSPNEYRAKLMHVVQKTGEQYTTKWVAIEALLNHMNITADCLCAFGDDNNDIDMIENAGVGVPVGNAIEEVKRKAKYVTLDNDQDGVAKFLKKYLL